MKKHTIIFCFFLLLGSLEIQAQQNFHLDSLIQDYWESAIKMIKARDFCQKFFIEEENEICENLHILQNQFEILENHSIVVINLYKELQRVAPNDIELEIESFENIQHHTEAIEKIQKTLEFFFTKCSL